MKGKVRSLVAKSLRGNELVWRYGFNFSPSLYYSLNHESGISKKEKEILDSLNRDGIAIAHVDDLFVNGSEFEELAQTVESMLISREEEITRLAAEANDTSRIGSKTFNLQLLGSELTFSPASIFSRFALTPAFVKVANAYLKMYARLRYYNVWYTFATDSAARESQLWHFDREDNYILKIFVYLKDVKIGTGPFTYAPGTHRKGHYWDLKPDSFEEGGVLRTSDDQMDAVIPRQRWITATGRRGTIVFADTRGYHKGGEARADNRLMFTCMYTSPASDSKDLIKYSGLDTVQQLSKEQRLALRIKG